MARGKLTPENVNNIYDYDVFVDHPDSLDDDIVLTLRVRLRIQETQKNVNSQSIELITVKL